MPLGRFQYCQGPGPSDAVGFHEMYLLDCVEGGNSTKQGNSTLKYVSSDSKLFGDVLNPNIATISNEKLEDRYFVYKLDRTKST